MIGARRRAQAARGAPTQGIRGMDGAFACPECGNTVEIRGLAPGRQVRCGFCRRLLEVPYLPRAYAGWKRRRFHRPKWVVWSYVAIGIVAAILLSASAFRLVKREYRSSQDRSIKHMVQLSRQHEAEGRFSEALIDLDAALELAEKAGPATLARMERERKDRPLLARRDVEVILERLRKHDPSTFPVGDWLNLMARAARDPDLDPLVQPIEQQFQSSLKQQVSTDLERARRSFDSGQVVDSIQACDRIAALCKHLAPEGREGTYLETEKLVIQLVSTRGVNVAPPAGQFIFGSLSGYVSELLPLLTKGLEKKGYLPVHESSPWREVWKNARYQVRLEVKERLEGRYPPSENRLTRIEAPLSLTSTDGFTWNAIPTARSTVPLPHVRADFSVRAAAGSERSSEFEKLLYDDARGKIKEKFASALTNMPECSPPRS
jgi:hypothetical protein